MTPQDLLQYIEANVLNDVVAFYNSLPPAERDVPQNKLSIFQPKVIESEGGEPTTIFGDVGQSNVLAQLTYGLKGTPETAVPTDFIELSRYIIQSSTEVVTRIISGVYVGDQPLQETIAGVSPIVEWVKNLDPLSLDVKVGELVLFSVERWTDNGLSGGLSYYGPDQTFDPTGLEHMGTSLYAWTGGEGSPIVPSIDKITHVLSTTPSSSATSTVVELDGTNPVVTLTSSNSTQYIRVTSATPVTISVPQKANVNWKQGAEIHIEQSGLGQVSFIGEEGVTIQAAQSFNLKTREQFAVVTLKNVTTDKWTIFGLLEQV